MKSRVIEETVDCTYLCVWLVFLNGEGVGWSCRCVAGGGRVLSFLTLEVVS
jgi:hypothetical protein